MSVRRYAFIDGHYLQTVHQTLMNNLFEKYGEIDFRKLRDHYGISKIFYYDSLPTVKSNDETSEEFETRLSEKDAQFNRIDRVERVHVRRGTQRRGLKSREQKEVDVLLAVDAMKFAFRDVIDEALIFSGDLDFRPLVESLVEQGTNVQVFADARGGAQDLLDAADSQILIDMQLCHSWSNDEFQKNNSIPNKFLSDQIPKEYQSTHLSGFVENKKCRLYVRPDVKQFIIAVEGQGEKLFISHRNWPILKRYLSYDMSPFQWTFDDKAVQALL